MEIGTAYRRLLGVALLVSSGCGGPSDDKKSETPSEIAAPQPWPSGSRAEAGSPGSLARRRKIPSSGQEKVSSPPGDERYITDKEFASSLGSPSKFNPKTPQVPGKPPPQAPDRYTKAFPVIKVTIEEFSGMALDRARGLLWSHGDSGTDEEVGLTRLDTRETWALGVRGASNRDWEAMSLSPEGELWIIDSGDNWHWRHSVTAYCLGVPDPQARELSVRRSIEFEYPDGSQNVEAAFIREHFLYLVQRTGDDGKASQVYRIDVSASAPQEQKAEVAGALEPIGPITDASLSPSGALYLLTYRGIYRVTQLDPSQTSRAERVAGDWHWGQVESLAAVGNSDFLVGREDGLIFRWKDGAFIDNMDDLELAVVSP